MKTLLMLLLFVGVAGAQTVDTEWLRAAKESEFRETLIALWDGYIQHIDSLKVLSDWGYLVLSDPAGKVRCDTLRVTLYVRRGAEGFVLWLKDPVAYDSSLAKWIGREIFR